MLLSRHAAGMSAAAAAAAADAERRDAAAAATLRRRQRRQPLPLSAAIALKRRRHDVARRCHAAECRRVRRRCRAMLITLLRYAARRRQPSGRRFHFDAELPTLIATPPLLSSPTCCRHAADAVATVAATPPLSRYQRRHATIITSRMSRLLDASDARRAAPAAAAAHAAAATPFTPMLHDARCQRAALKPRCRQVDTLSASPDNRRAPDCRRR